uniref:rRNA adenine N(6)-methyltransferase n=1 Tax=Psilocybe cubensis TaxID=181762 RepID=A0A8H7Y7I9_PSICU
MATVQFSRTLWQYSRCARLDLERSMVSSSSFLQRRSTFATVSSSHLNDIQSEASQSSYSDEHSELTEGVDFPKQRKRRVNADLGADVLSASEKQKRKETLKELVNAIHARAAADVSGSLSPSEIADLSKEPASLHSVEGSELLAGIEIRQRRKRRTKAEMLAAAAEQEIEIRQRRKRRTKAEMLAAAAEQEALNPKPRRRRRSGETEETPTLGRPPGKGYRKPLPRPQRKSSSGTQLINMETDNPSGEIPFLNLPPMAQWKEVFSHVRESKRPTLRNPETALMLADKIIPEGSKDKVIIEAFSGPGQLSRALLKLPRERIKKLIILESVPHYWKYVKVAMTSS